MSNKKLTTLNQMSNWEKGKLATELLLKATTGSFNRLLNLPGSPRVVDFVISYLCNSRCLTCGIWKIYLKDKSRLKEEAKTEEIIRFLDQNPYLEHLSISGGELYLRDDIEDIWLAMDERGYTTGTTTNAVDLELTERKEARLLKRLSGRNVHIFQVSVDGLGIKHDRIRGIKGNFANAVALIKWALVQKEKYPFLEVWLSHTLLPNNYQEFEELIDYFVALGIKPEDISFRVACCQEFFWNNAGLLSSFTDKYGEIAEMIRRVRSKKQIHNDFFTTGLVRYLKNPRERIVKCYAAHSFCNIDPYWNVYPCNSLPFCMGNLRDWDFDLKALWKSERAIQARKLVSAGKCPNCWTKCSSLRSAISGLENMVKLIPYINKKAI